MSGDKVRELVEAIGQKAKEHIKVNTAWVKCTEIDWENKTMTGVGVSDNLEYFEVSLGLGAITIKPVINNLCLIGIIENKETETFLIEATEVDKYYLNAVEIVFNDGENGGVVKVNPLKTELEKLNSNMEILIEATKAIATVANALTPGTSVAFETAVGFMESQDLSDLENEEVKH
ncbi:MAG: hypothetical protein ACEQSR_01320 [Candidatus Methylacidiphilales bacterium]